MPRTVIIYAYYETGPSILNLNFFIKKGLFEDNDYQFFFIIQGEKVSPQIPNLPNVTVLKKKNEGHDFGAWGHGINHININEYDYFVFINSTVRGPFLPRWLPNTIRWPDLFTHKIDDKYKLCGVSINYNVKVIPKEPSFWAPHIQSMFFCTDKIGLSIMLDKDIFVPPKPESNSRIDKKNAKTELIRNNEVRMSTEILAAGYELYAMQLSENINRKIYESGRNLESLHGDIVYMNKYYDISINPLEVIFIKTNRIKDKVVENYTAWSNV